MTHECNLMPQLYGLTQKMLSDRKRNDKAITCMLLEPRSQWRQPLCLYAWQRWIRVKKMILKFVDVSRITL